MSQINNRNFNFGNLRILQWNAKSVLSKYNELSKHCENFNLILISETWLSQDKEFKLRGFDTVREDRLDRGGGVLIAIRNNVRYRRVHETCGGKVEACAIEILVGGEPLTVVSCYRPPGAGAGSVAIRDWEKFFSQFQGRVLFGGDFNAHNVVWGSASTCRTSDNLWEAVGNGDLSLLNDGSVTFHCASFPSSSVIDLTMS